MIALCNPFLWLLSPERRNIVPHNLPSLNMLIAYMEWQFDITLDC